MATRKKQLAILLRVLGLFILASACTRNIYVPVEHRIQESEQKIRIHSDTVLIRDSVFLSQRGDTVVREVFRWRWRNRFVTDTVYIERNDTVIRSEITNDKKKLRTSNRSWLSKIKVITVILAIIILSLNLLYFLNYIRKSR